MSTQAGTQTAAELATEWRCSARKVKAEARKHRIGANLRGSAGWRFTPAQKDALWAAMQPPAPEPAKRHRKTRRTA